MTCSRGIIICVPLVTALAILSCIVFILSTGDCPEGNFTCPKSKTCVLQRSVCDGSYDCPEGEDEEEMYCRDSHGSFWEMVDNVDLRTPNDSCELEMVPQNCQCVETSVVCSNLSLVELPSPISRDLKRITLDYNNITSLPKGAFDNFSLHLMQVKPHLGYNSINHIPDDAFQGQFYLRKLYLMGNYLEILPSSLMKLPNLNWLFLEDNKLSFLSLDKWQMTSLKWLNLSKNLITLMNETFPTLPELKILFLEHNAIQIIRRHTFSNLTVLIDLSLAWNSIQHIENFAFSKLINLKDLDLKNNFIVKFVPTCLPKPIKLQKFILGGNSELQMTNELLKPLTNLRSLDLEDIEMSNANLEYLASFKNLDFVYFKRFKYCMSVPQVPKCLPLSDGTSTSEDLLANDLLRSTLWLVSIFTLAANVMVIWRRFTSSANKFSPLNIIITNLALADLLMGIYLMAVGLEDLTTRGIFRTVAERWRSSVFCTLLGVIAMVSSEVSILILLLISVERFMLISAPLSGFQSLNRKTALMTSIAVWAFALILAILPVVEWRHSMRFYGTNSFCFPLHIDEPYLAGWQYSGFVFIGINSVSLLGIAFLYLGVFLSILKTRHATTLSVNDSELALRFFFIVLTNACCWVPIVILKILVFLDVSISKEVYGWLGVFVLPINSAVNPILYTFTKPRFRNSPTANKLPSNPGTRMHSSKKAASKAHSFVLALSKWSPRKMDTPSTTDEQV